MKQAEKNRLFGTDGVRGTANRYPLTPEIALSLARSAVQVLAPGHSSPRVLIGRDSRLSGEMIEAAVVAGLTSAGATPLLAGVIPTPAVAFLTRSLKADLGVAITASHNSFEDNGIKFFKADGYKLDDLQEDQIEKGLGAQEDHLRLTGRRIGRSVSVPDAVQRYIAFGRHCFPSGLSLQGMRIVVDCANGAACLTSPPILASLGAEVLAFHQHPDGTNINEACGSTFPEELSRLVRSHGAALGISHDGDADRLILCDETGSIVDGDELLAIVACHMLDCGTLPRQTLVATVMSNFGLEECLAAHGGKVVRTAVGDRYVLEEMLRGDYQVGGEQSGHMIFRRHTTTGDGIVSALEVLAVLREKKIPLSVARQILKKYPQKLVNMRIRRRLPLEEMPHVVEALARARQILGERGRVFLRFSGTEPKVRLLLEGPDAAQLESLAGDIVGPLAEAIGESA